MAPRSRTAVAASRPSARCRLRESSVLSPSPLLSRRFSRVSDLYQANALCDARDGISSAIDCRRDRRERGYLMLYTEQHRELMRSVTKFVEAEIDPHAEEWEAAGGFPAHELFRKMGKQGLLGIP